MTFFPAVSKSAYGVLFAETEIDHDHEEVPVSPVAPWSDFEGHRRFVESAYPVTHFGIQPLPGIGKAAPNPQPFTTITGANTWAFAMLANLPAGSKMYVLEPWATPGVHGYAWGTGLAEGENARDGRIGIVMAQEMAHVYGNWCHTFDETPCNYPRKSGWIDSEDTGFNLSGNYGKPLELVSRIGERDALNVLDEQLTISDFMSYNAAPAWISSFTSCQLIHLLWPNNVPTVCIPGVRPTVAATPPPAPFAAPQAYLLVAGRFGTAGGATIDLVEPIPSSEDVSTPQEWTTSHSVRVLDAMGRSLLDFPFLANHSDHDEGTHFAYSVVLPFEQVRANAAAVALLDATGTPLARWDLPTASPVVRTLTGPSPVPGTNLVSGKKTVTWTADDPAGRALKCTLLYSADGGVRWWPLNTGLSGTSAVVDFDAVPGSEAAMLKIRASNGGRWAEAVTTVPFRVARQAPEVAIVQPDTDVALGARESLLLQGRAFTWEDGDLNGPGALTWSTDTGPLGSGSWVVVRSLRSGPHVITLQATAPDGRTAKTTVTVIVGTN